MNVTLRVSNSNDKDFLWRLNELAYEEVIAAQFGTWDRVDQKARFEAKWLTQCYSIIVVDDVPVGALSTTVSSEALVINEVLLLPEYQNLGIGSEVMRGLQREAGNLKVPMLLQVLHLNKARRLYERLGFRVYERTETHFRMRFECAESPPPEAGTPTAKSGILRGMVRSGLGDFGFWLDKLREHYREKTGMALFPGTLNLELPEPFRVPPSCLRLEGHEYGGTVSVSIVPCRVFGRQAFILRTDANERGTGDHPRTIVEIATDVKLRDIYTLRDGDLVEIELESTVTL